jgi:hypothetical protein
MTQLNATSYHQRVAAQLELQRGGAAAVEQVMHALKAGQLGVHARMHAIWIITRTVHHDVPDVLFTIATSDPDPRVRVQAIRAIRAIADLTDPVLVNTRIRSARGDAKIVTRIAAIAEHADPGVVLEALILMRRMRWLQSPQWIAAHLSAEDPALNHAAQQAMRSAANWPGVDRLLDASPRLRKLALHAMAEHRVPYLADQLIDRLQRETNPQHRREYADALSRIARSTEPRTYWGFRPAARPAATVDWEKTETIELALNAALSDSDFDVRAFILARMLREGFFPELSALADWLSLDTSESHIAVVLQTLNGRDADAIQPVLERTILRQDLSESNRSIALSILLTALAEETQPLIQLAERLDDGPVLAAVLREFGSRRELEADDVLLQKFDSSSSVVRPAPFEHSGNATTRPLLLTSVVS